MDPIDELMRREILEDLLASILPRYREVVERRARGETLRAIGEDMGVGPERVRQIQHKATWQMRFRAKKKHGIEDMSDLSS